MVGSGNILILSGLCQLKDAKFLALCLSIFERQTECKQRRGRESGTQNPKQAPGSELSAQSPTWGSNTPAVRS